MENATTQIASRDIDHYWESRNLYGVSGMLGVKKLIAVVLVFMLSGPVMADTYWCDSSVRSRTLNVTWAECPRHSWLPYVKALYDGYFMNGEFYGQGTYTWEDGSVYTGKWRDGKMHGWGTLTFPNGDKYKGIWSKDKFVKGDVYTDAENCAVRLTSNYYLPAEDACYKN